MENITLEPGQGVATITLNRPDRLNALTSDMRRELLQAVKQVARDDDARCLVLTGAGRAFCSGEDLKDRQEGAGSFQEVLEREYNPLVKAIYDLEKPVLAAINGVAAGAGCSLVLACDLRVAKESAKLTQAFSRVGLIPDSGATYLLPRLVGLGRAMEMALLSSTVSAAEALEIGLVNRVYPDQEFDDQVQQLAQQLAAGPTLAYGLIKRAVHRALDSSLDEALAYEASLQQVVGESDDHQEGLAAFLQKRAANFEGR